MSNRVSVNKKNTNLKLDLWKQIIRKGNFKST